MSDWVEKRVKVGGKWLPVVAETEGSYAVTKNNKTVTVKKTKGLQVQTRSRKPAVA